MCVFLVFYDYDFVIMLLNFDVEDEELMFNEGDLIKVRKGSGKIG